uniref:NADH-ubiquinone oxidoreductase chain 2 n=1 Tax=Cystobasidium sp. TaxID=1925428 RepID=A0A6M4SP21_9BASI|nr:NADH dehydrogenase subunit 2 [Cystobasidium sp.]
MLLIGLTSLLIAIPLYSSSITPTLLTRITTIILLFGAALSFNGLYVQAIGSGLGLYSGLFHVTTVTQFMEVFLYTTGAIILLPWQKDNGRSIAEYPLIILFTTIGASFLISSADLVSMYLSIELQSFAVYILAAIYRNSESATSAGLKYFLLGALSSALILLGSSIIYSYTGLTSFESIYTIANAASSDSVTQGVVLGMLMIGVGFLFKVAAAPFHNWAPDVYDGVPTIVTTWLTVMPKISIFIFLLGLDFQGSAIGFSDQSSETINLWKNLLLTTSLLSLVVGTVVGLAQYRIKRLLAFSTISHVGFMLLALSVSSEESITSFLFYLMQYSITNLNAFFVLLAFGYRTGASISFISQLKGQFLANPILGLSFALCLFSMAGIPPLVGFFAKYRVLYSAMENGYYFLSLVGIIASVISAAYYLRVIRVIHFDVDHNIEAKENTVSLTSTHSYVIAVLTLFVLFFILSQSLLLNSSNLLALSLFTA